MGNFNKFDKNRGGGGGRGFGGGHFGGGNRGFGGRNDGPRQMFPSVCSKCGQDCEVPFKPTGDRPVLCSNCFKSQGGPANRFAPKSFGGGNRGGNVGGSVSKEQFDSLNAKLDKILSILAPTKVKDSPKADMSEIKSKKEIVKKVKIPAKKSKSKKK